MEGIMAAVDISSSKRKYKTLGALAKGMRIRRHLTQTEVAAKCELALSAVRDIENNLVTANYCYDYIFALGHMRKRGTTRTEGGNERAGRARKKRRKRVS